MRWLMKTWRYKLYNFGADLKITDTQFSGTVNLNGSDICVFGEFVLEWDGTRPIVIIVNCTQYSSGNIDFRELARNIESVGNNKWYENRLNKLSEEV